MSTFHTGVYPGTFDPITFGHIDIIQRSSVVVDELIIGVASNIHKSPLFTLEERIDMVEREIKNLPKLNSDKIKIYPITNLLIHFCRDVKATIIIRGLRAVSDFEYEFQMAGMNVKLDSSVDTIFLMASERYQFVSSRFIKEIYELNGDISSFVPAYVIKQLDKKMKPKI
ncbi:MAG: pantetheine-phosphate adenylyltransferase [Alphaproteobacteria bacterium]|nr:pantetheine-phosphate adenylyltransferase [Alphaproteobacteria bacterium]